MLTFIDGASSTGALRRERDRGDGVVGHAGGEPRDHVGGRGRDHDEVGAVGELDVTDRRLLGQREQIGEHRVARQRLERHRPDEVLRALGHRDVHGRAGLVEQPHQLGGLVRRDAAGHADDDLRALRADAPDRAGRDRFEVLWSRGDCTPDHPVIRWSRFDTSRRADRRRSASTMRCASGRNTASTSDHRNTSASHCRCIEPGKRSHA